MVNVHLCKKNHNNQVHQKKLLFLATTKKNTIVLFLKTRHDLETWYFAQRYVRTFSWTWWSRNFEFRLIKKLLFLATTKKNTFVMFLKTRHDLETWYFAQRYVRTFSWTWRSRNFEFRLIKKVFFLVTTKKTQIFDILSIENGCFYNHLLLVVGTYGQCAFM